MTPVEVSEVLGCSAQHVRSLIREEKLKATRRHLYNAPGGRVMYLYEIPEEEVARYKEVLATRGVQRGCPLGTKRNKKRRRRK